MVLDWPQAFGLGLALLVTGVLCGELWAKLRTPRERDPRRGGRPHYLLGLNYLVSNQASHAIRELSRAVRQETDAVEAYLALGNLFREDGQTERAIDIHKSLLHRSDLSSWERTQVLLSLAMDFQKAGMVDRAERTFEEVSERDSNNLGAHYALQRLAEESGRWEDALRIQERIQRISRGSEPYLAAAIETEWARAIEDQDPDAAAARYRSALSRRPDYAPARLGLGTYLVRVGRSREAIEHLEQVVNAGPPWAQASLEPLAEASADLGEHWRLEQACEAVLERDPRAWRAELALAREHLRSGDLGAARSDVKAALSKRPGSLAVQRELWELLQKQGGGIDEFLTILDEALEDARLADPFVCFRCRFKSTELFARCPHCHEWGAMGEERWE